MAFRIEVSAEAERDAIGILDWLTAEEAGDAGFLWFLRMQEAIQSLDMLPERCPVAPESADFPFEIRQLLFGRKPHVYRILFTISDGSVRVLAIRHGRRQRIP